jgi:RNA ligase
MQININEFESRVKAGLIKKFIDGDYIGWCYTQKCQWEKKWDEHTIIARGIVTLANGIVISRPFTKFFNLGEPEAEPISWTDKITATDKIDGSLIIVSFHNGQMILNSKGSFTSEHANFARKWIADNMSKWKNAEMKRSLGGNERWTYLFESIFPEVDNIKVINYGDRADLTLLAVINVNTGSEWSYDMLKQTGNIIGVGVVKRYPFDDINLLLKKCKEGSIVDGEGIVLHFDPSGKRIKVKSDEYIRLHRLISHTSRKHILDVLIKGDDVESIYTALPDELFAEVKKIVSEIKDEFNSIQMRAKVVTDTIKPLPTKKEQALYLLARPELADVKNVVFEMLEGKDGTKSIWSFIRKNTKEETEKEEI